MKRINSHFFVCAILLTVLCSCDKTESDCGKRISYETAANRDSYFTNPADIYWGVTSGIRSYTYNYEFGNICTKQNPQVYFTLSLLHSNAGSGNPISVKAGVYTCLGIQPQHVTMAPDANQKYYRSEPAEIGMNQCFSCKASATIYPYITVSFNTLGSSHDDSLYFVQNVVYLLAYIDYNEPK
jgi:hypothetical protein